MAQTKNQVRPSITKIAHSNTVSKNRTDPFKRLALPKSSEPIESKVVQMIECKYGLYCKRSNCKFYHKSPASIPQDSIRCKFMGGCLNKRLYNHQPLRFRNRTLESKHFASCKYTPLCNRSACPYQHPSTSNRIFALDDSDVTKQKV